VSVEDLFFNVPARLKFLKSAQTEFFYCYNYFVDVALWHYDKERVMKKNDKVNFDLKPARDLKDRIVDIYKKDWKKNLHTFEYQTEGMKLNGVVSDASLRFGSGENIKIYVNGRPVQDKIIRKALLDAYNRQITPGEYPFVVLMLEIDPKLVDVNVHPSKLNVKFANSKTVFETVYTAVSQALGGERIANFSHGSSNTPPLTSFASPLSGGKKIGFSSKLPSVEQLFDFSEEKNSVSPAKVSSIFGLESFVDGNEASKQFFHAEVGEYQVLGQLRNSYIVLQSQEALYYIDQHALAERIAYETMKKETDLHGEVLLQPLKFEITQIANLAEKIEELNQL
jgi:DNA mismatch repair protein MutL